MNFEVVIGQAARRAGRYIPVGLDRDDLMQIGHLALLEAERAGRLNIDDPLHLKNRARQRALGAMIDAIRANYDQRPQGTTSVDEDDSPIERAGHGDPLRSTQINQAVAQFEAKAPSQSIEVLTMLIAGMTQTEIAAELGVSVSRITQIRSAARREFDRLLNAVESPTPSVSSRKSVYVMPREFVDHRNEALATRQLWG